MIATTIARPIADYIVVTLGGVAPESTAYFDRIAAAGGSISQSQKDAVNTFVMSAKAHGYWGKLLDVGTLTGADLVSARVKLKVHSGTATSLVNTGFVAGDYNPSLGIKGGTGKRFDTGFNYATYGSLLFGHSFFLNDDIPFDAGGGIHYFMGHTNGLSPYCQLYFNGSYPTGQMNSLAPTLSKGGGQGRGLCHFYQSTLSLAKARYGGRIFATDATTVSTAQPNTTCAVCGTSDGASSCRFSFYAVDNGQMSDAEATAFGADALKLNVDLGRVVKKPTKFRYAFIVGQSLADGSFGTPVLSVAQAYANKNLTQACFTATVGTISNIIHLYFTPYVEVQNETIGGGFLNFQSALWRADHAGDDSMDMAFSKYGVGGASISTIKKGGSWGYADSVASVSGILPICADYSNAGMVVPGILSVHGETDLSLATYQAEIEQWQVDYETDIKAITGQSEPVVMFHSQPSFWSVDGNAGMAKSPLAMLAAHEANSAKSVLVCAKYRLPHYDGLHLTNTSYRWLGEMYAKAWDKVINRGQVWEPLRPVSIVRSGAVITVTFTGNVGNIQFDTVAVTDPNGKKGFEYTDGSSPPAISAVAITGANTLTVTLASVPTGANKTLRYAMTSVGASGTNCGGPTTGPRGCLCDSDSTVSPNGYDLRNWCVHFSKLVVDGGGSGDVDANDFISRAGIIDTTQQNAVTTLVTSLKSANIWTKMRAIYPFVGGTAASHAENLKSSSYQITWTGSITHDASGITGAGGGGDTGLDLSLVGADRTSVAFGVYNKSSVAQGATDISGAAAQFVIYTRYTDGNFYASIVASGGWLTPIPGGVTDARGFFVVVRRSASAAKAFKNGSVYVDDNANVASGSITAGNFLLLGASTHNLALAFISDGLSDTEASQLSTAVETYQVTLGRQNP